MGMRSARLAGLSAAWIAPFGAGERPAIFQTIGLGHGGLPLRPAWARAWWPAAAIVGRSITVGEAG